MTAIPPKRVKMTGIERVPSARFLLKAPLSLPSLPSPASPFGCRVAVRTAEPGGSTFDVYGASSNQLFHFQMPRDPGKPVSAAGKEGLVVPTEVKGTTEVLEHVPHEAEIQSITLHEDEGVHLLGSVDAFGRAVVQRWRPDGPPAEVPGASSTYALPPAAPRAATEAGWGGISFCPGQPSLAATASYFGRTLDLYDGDLRVRTFNTAQHPTALRFLASGAPGTPAGGAGCSILLCEANQVSLWDHRVGERGGCVQRVISGWGGGHLYAVDVASAGEGGGLASYEGLVAVAGEERHVCVYDPRKWAVRARWPGAHKYEITSLHFSRGDPRFCFVGGADYEVLCGQWDVEGGRGGRVQQGFAFRGDERWGGLARAPRSDLIAGWTTSVNAFVCDVEMADKAEVAA